MKKGIKIEKGLSNAIQQIKEKFGDGAIMKLDDAKKVNVDAIPTGSPSLDIALGIGGIPKGRIIEIYGPEGSGKTTLSLHIIAEAQKKGDMVAFVDAEHALDSDYAKRIGVKTEELHLSQPNSGEEALQIVDILIKSKEIGLVVIDSVAALTPRTEIDGEIGDQFIGLQARLMSQALRKLTALAAKANTSIVFINQLRTNISSFGYGNPETTSGGRALKFYSSVRIDLRRIAQIKKGEDVIGSHVKAKVVKNKTAPPFKIAEFDILSDGISYESDLINIGVKNEVIRKSGAFFYYGEEKLGQGQDNARLYLKENKKLTKEISKKIWKI